MSRVHPAFKEEEEEQQQQQIAVAAATDWRRTRRQPSVLWTVWKKSSMAFHGTDGFSIYDGNGRLAFRVENYERKHKCFAGELLLMDGEGRPLMTLRPQILSMHDRWIGFKCEDDGSEKSSKSQVFCMRRRSIIGSCDKVQIFMESCKKYGSLAPDFTTQGCFRKRNCNIFDANGDQVVQISRKKVNKTVTLGDDVFSLIVHPKLDTDLVMAFLVALDRIC